MPSSASPALAVESALSEVAAGALPSVVAGVAVFFFSGVDVEFGAFTAVVTLSAKPLK